MVRPHTRWFRFTLVGLTGIAVQVALVTVLVDRAGLHVPLATLLAVGSTVVHNFLWHLRWTWADRVRGASLTRLFLGFTAANGLVSLVGNTVLVTLLVGVGVSTTTGALIAIAACGLVNFTLADRVVFTPPRWHGPDS